MFWFGAAGWIATSGDGAESAAAVLVFWLVPVAVSLALSPKFLNDLEGRLRAKQ
ncbi:hypothetical protein [Gordonia iterans]